MYYLECFDLYNPYFGRRYIDDNTGLVGFDDRHLPFQEIKHGIFKRIKHTPIFEKCREVKYNCNDFQCISLHPKSNVTYLDVYIEDHHSETETIDTGSEDSDCPSEEDYDF